MIRVDFGIVQIVCLCVYLTFFLTFFFPFFLSLCFFSYLFTSLLVYFLTSLSTFRMDYYHFQAGGHRRRPNLALVFFGLFYVVVYFVYACLLLLCLFQFLVLSQEIGWEERLRNDLFCVRWDVKP